VRNSSSPGNRLSPNAMQSGASPLAVNARAPALPNTGFLREWQILGDPIRGHLPLIPISRSSWWNGVRTGRYPPPLKLGPKMTVWRVEDIRALIDRIAAGAVNT
jgi:prophage regulatory protein